MGALFLNLTMQNLLGTREHRFCLKMAMKVKKMRTFVLFFAVNKF